MTRVENLKLSLSLPNLTLPLPPYITPYRLAWPGPPHPHHYSIVLYPSNNLSIILIFAKHQSTMALIPNFFGGGRRSNIFDPFSLDVWDPFDGFPIGGAVANVPSSATKDAFALANVHIDWRETPDAHIIEANLPGLDKGEVKVEIEDGRIL